MLDFGSSFRHDARMILELHSPLDMHLHLRDGDMLKLVAPLSSASFAGAVVMPNLVPPVADAEAVQAYRGHIMDACGGDVFKPYMTAFFRSYTEKELERLKDLVFGIKLYPAGATTNSEGGVKAMKDAEATMAMMQEMGIPLLVHGETHGFVMDREAEFLDIYRNLAEQFPRLTICMEHITTAAAVRLLEEGTAACQRQVLIKQLEAVGQGQENADGEGTHHVGDGDLPQHLPAVGTVDTGGLQHILRNGLQTGDIDDHHIADLLPAHQNNQSPEAIDGGIGQCPVHIQQYTI